MARMEDIDTRGERGSSIYTEREREREREREEEEK